MGTEREKMSPRERAEAMAAWTDLAAPVFGALRQLAVAEPSIKPIREAAARAQQAGEEWSADEALAVEMALAACDILDQAIAKVIELAKLGAGL